MTKEEYQSLIVQIVGNGIKAVDLATRLAVQLSENNIDVPYDVWTDGLVPLITSGELIEIEYVVPDVDYRIKSFLLPKGTQIYLKKKDLYDWSDD
jgi:hypothetical protein